MLNDVFFQLKPSLNSTFTDASEDETVLFNMDGDYSYLTEGYYRSLDAQVSGKLVIPNLEETLDAYVVPLALEKAQLSKLAVPDYKVVNDSVGIEPPVLAYPINPFSERFELITEPEEAAIKIKAVTRSGKYAAIVQKLPPDDYRIDTLRCVLGKTLAKEYEDFAWRIFKIFRLPLMKVKVIVTASAYLFSSISPLKFAELTLNEKKILEGIGTWQE